MQAWIREVFDTIAGLRRQIEALFARLAIWQNPRQTRLAVTVPDPYTGDYPCNPANTFWIVFVDGSFPENVDGVQDWTIKARQKESEPLTTAMGVGLDSFLPKYSLIVVHFINKQWWFVPPRNGLVRLRLEEDHPGYRGAEFKISIGTERESTHGWLFTQTTYDAIDWWHSEYGPYPAKCSQGYGEWQLAESLNEIPTKPPKLILHIVGLDCNSPGCDAYYCY